MTVAEKDSNHLHVTVRENLSFFVCVCVCVFLYCLFSRNFRKIFEHEYINEGYQSHRAQRRRCD